MFVVFSIANGKSASYFTEEMENASEGEILHEACRDSPPHKADYNISIDLGSRRNGMMPMKVTPFLSSHGFS